MVRFADDQLERLHRSVAAAASGRVVADELAVAQTEIRAGRFVSAAPAAQADDLVVFGPLGKRRTGEVVDEHAAAVLDVINERLLGVLRPLVALVVQHDQRIVAELGLESAHVLPLERRRRHVHLEHSALLKQLFQHRTGLFPVVGVLAVDDQSLVRRIGPRDRHHQQTEQQGGQPRSNKHVNTPWEMGKSGKASIIARRQLVRKIAPPLLCSRPMQGSPPSSHSTERPHLI